MYAGHINFNDEVTAAMRMCDGVLLVVDAVEGVMVSTEKAIRQAMQENLPICLLLSKVQCTACYLLLWQAQQSCCGNVHASLPSPVHESNCGRASLYSIA